MSAYIRTVANPWRVLDELMEGFPFDSFDQLWRRRGGRFPRVNVWENEQELTLQAEVAGVEPEQLDVLIDANVLTLKGSRVGADGEEREFQRSFNLPFELDDEKVKAVTRNGMLTVTIPRKAAQKRKIAIEKL